MGTREEPTDLVAALGELADLRSRVDNAQRLADMGDYDWHIETDKNTWSDQLFRIYGYEPGAIQASYDVFMQHVHPDDRDKVRAVHQQAYASGEPYEMVERIVRPDGEVRALGHAVAPGQEGDRVVLGQRRVDVVGAGAAVVGGQQDREVLAQHRLALDGVEEVGQPR